VVSLEFFIDVKPSGHTKCPVVDSASNRDECQEYFFGGKGGR